MVSPRDDSSDVTHGLDVANSVAVARSVAVAGSAGTAASIGVIGSLFTVLGIGTRSNVCVTKCPSLTRR